MKLRERISSGLEGMYQGLSNGFTRVNKYLFGIQRAAYYLIGGGSGVGKTTLVDYMVLEAIEDAAAKNIKLDIFYYSYEIDELTKKCNWLSVIIYKKYGRIIAPEKIKGLGDNRLDKDEQEIVDSEIDYIEDLFEKIHFRFVPTNPTGIYNELWKHGEANGEFIYETYVEGGVPLKKIVGYKPNDPHSYTIVVLDHLYHLKKQEGLSGKEVIDKYSSYCVSLRNMFKFTFINIQQFNRNLSSVERQKFKGVDISPQESDFKETSNTYSDSDVVIGLMNPYKLDLEDCLGYNISRFKEKFIMFKIIKNRLSKDNIAVGLYANFNAGSFTELPRPEEIDYSKLQ